MPASNQRALWALLLVQFVGALGFTITLPLMPYYAATFGADPLMVGMISASYAICALVAGPIFGRLSDRQGRRPWLLLSQLGTLVGFVVTAIGGSLGVLFLGRIIDGISGGNQVIAQAYVGDVTRPEERTRVYGLMGAAFGLGAVVGPVLGGGLSRFGYSVPFWVAAGISALTLLMTFFFLPESRRASATGTRAAPLRALLGLLGEAGIRRALALYGLMTLIFSLFVASIGLYMQLKLAASPFVAGLMVAYYGVVSVVSKVTLVPQLARRFAEGRLVALGLLGLAGAMTILSLAGSIGVSLGGVTLLVLGMALLRPAATSLLSQLAGPERQGTVMGATISLQSVSDIVAPLVAGALIAVGLLGAPFALAALLALAALVFRPAAAPVASLASTTLAEADT